MNNTRKQYKKSKARAGKKWSAGVTEKRNALDLQSGIFTGSDAHKIALSLKHSANKSHRRKGTPYQAAMSMLNFYINRAGKGLPDARKRVLARAKDELRKAFGRV